LGLVLGCGPDGVIGPDGVVGVCCPRDQPTCDCFRTGGWAPSLELCPRTCDLDPRSYEVVEDAYGCPQYRFYGERRGCCLCPPDAGSPEDAGDAAADGAVDATADGTVAADSP
jgi:hypothetical protein